MPKNINLIKCCSGGNLFLPRRVRKLEQILWRLLEEKVLEAMIDVNLFLDKKKEKQYNNLKDEFNEIGVKSEFLWLLKVRETDLFILESRKVKFYLSCC